MTGENLSQRLPLPERGLLAVGWQKQWLERFPEQALFAAPSWYPRQRYGKVA